MKKSRWRSVIGLGVVLGLWAISPVHAQSNVYVTTVDEYDDDVFELANGALLEKSSYGYVGYIGYRTEAALFATAGGARLWVAGKGVFDVDVLRSPQTDPNAHAALVWVTEVRGGGEFLELDSGELLEVDEIDKIVTGLWIAPFEALLLDDGRLLNLDEPSDEMVWIVDIR